MRKLSSYRESHELWISAFHSHGHPEEEKVIVSSVYSVFVLFVPYILPIRCFTHSYLFFTPKLVLVFHSCFDLVSLTHTLLPLPCSLIENLD